MKAEKTPGTTDHAYGTPPFHQPSKAINLGEFVGAQVCTPDSVGQLI